MQKWVDRQTTDLTCELQMQIPLTSPIIASDSLCQMSAVFALYETIIGSYEVVWIWY